MPITEKQLADRDRRIGGSDVPSILGLNPFATAHDTWLKKTGRAPQRPQEHDGSSPSTLGTFLEDGLLTWAATKVGSIRRNQFRVAKKLDFPLGCNIDALVEKTGIPVEAKTAGLMHHTSEVWGEDGTDDIPERVIVQATAHMICTETDHCHVPALVGGLGLRLYKVQRNEDVVKAIIEQCGKFWDSVERDMPPGGSGTLEILKKLKRTPAKSIQISDDTYEKYCRAREAQKNASNDFEAAQAALLTELADAEEGICTLGSVTYYEQQRKGYVVQDGVYRVLRTPKPKKGN